eukprot:3432244-Alexandrium_andersonii.AAC.1
MAPWRRDRQARGQAASRAASAGSNASGRLRYASTRRRRARGASRGRVATAPALQPQISSAPRALRSDGGWMARPGA